MGMKSIGFGYPGGPDRAANLENPVTSYSGGWKMKMQLCAAQLMNADVLMLDEPTGHLDVDNIKWLEDWLESFSGSIICTSHFSPFLDKMCTHIIDFQDRKLKTFKGSKGTTLTEFVEKYPEKKAYFELSNETMKHLGDFGVDPESASHTQISQLSGGMKVKVVLAASMWQNPHVLILDEPTNYLDREGLGA